MQIQAYATDNSQLSPAQLSDINNFDIVNAKINKQVDRGRNSSIKKALDFKIQRVKNSSVLSQKMNQMKNDLKIVTKADTPLMRYENKKEIMLKPSVKICSPIA